MTAPAVSVLMSVRDGAPWVRDAVQSVLDQSAADLELIVIDDGSVDATPALLGAVRDRRLLVERRPPAGLTASLNRAIDLARAPLLARLDADDTALPERLARQRRFLDAHPEVGLLGTGAREVDAAGRAAGVVIPPAGDLAIRRALIRRNPFVHSSVLMRRRIIDEVGGYDPALPVAQDYELWMRMSRVTRLANLPEPLVVRRLLPGRVSSARDGERLSAEALVRWRAVRGGFYPWWCAAFLVRPIVARLMPRRVRALVRHRLAPPRPVPPAGVAR
jgi:glycosyltransferase involved in cell wall biosynthesis